MVKVLFVCLGNICRSPTAEGVFRTLLEREGLNGEIVCDSAGTYSGHAGQPPDSRMTRAAALRGVDLSGLRARNVTRADFDRFDYVVAMDQDNYNDLSRLCPPDYKGRLARMMEFAPQLGRREVPDPYYGGADGFELVLDLIEEAAQGLLADIRANHP